VKTLRGITAPGILRLVVTLRAKKCKNSSSAQRYSGLDPEPTSAIALCSDAHPTLPGRL
jgi:hypothetical protein